MILSTIIKSKYNNNANNTKTKNVEYYDDDNTNNHKIFDNIKHDKHDIDL